MIYPIASCPYKNNDHENGVVAFIKEENHIEDIVSKGIVSISYSSRSSGSKDPSVMFKINNTNNEYFFSTKSTEPKYMLFDFTKYSIAFEGISIRTGRIDWYENYYIKTSYDNFQTDSKRILYLDSGKSTIWINFPFKKTRPSRFLNISVIGSSFHPVDNFAIYRIEFFGDIYRTSREIVCMFCTCQKLHLPQFKHLLSLSFMYFIK